MKVVERIKKPIYEEMELFEKKFKTSMSSRVALLNRITHFIVNRKGKQMRPMFVFLVAKMLGKGKINERSYRGAAVIELIHTATLVHDDVLFHQCFMEKQNCGVGWRLFALQRIVAFDRK